jgi:hypothetical protein
MSQNGNGQAGLEQLPYYREYVDQILKPRVGRIIEDIRSALTDQVWAELLDQMARDQGMPADAASVEKMRVLLEQGLKLRLSAHIVADFAGENGAAGGPGQAHVVPAPGAAAQGRGNADVIDPAFPNNPLARAVGGVRSVSR